MCLQTYSARTRPVLEHVAERRTPGPLPRKPVTGSIAVVSRLPIFDLVHTPLANTAPVVRSVRAARVLSPPKAKARDGTLGVYNVKVEKCKYFVGRERGLGPGGSIAIGLSFRLRNSDVDLLRY